MVLVPSWPVQAKPSTYSLDAGSEGVAGEAKPRHDDEHQPQPQSIH
jgi:hypothetical protein